MATALTQADLDKLEKAYARGVRTVSYAGQTVTFGSGDEMLKAIQYVKNAIAPAVDQRPASTYASFERC